MLHTFQMPLDRLLGVGLVLGVLFFPPGQGLVKYFELSRVTGPFFNLIFLQTAGLPGKISEQELIVRGRVHRWQDLCRTIAD